MIVVHRLSRPVSLPGLALSAVTLRRPSQADKDAVADEIARTAELSRMRQAAILIARLTMPDTTHSTEVFMSLCTPVSRRSRASVLGAAHLFRSAL